MIQWSNGVSRAIVSVSCRVALRLVTRVASYCCSTHR